MRVLHLAPTLQVGGAERFIERLAPTLAVRHGVDQRVVGLAGDGPIGVALRRQGISAQALSSGGITGLLRAARDVRAITADWQPDIVQTWLYIADLTGVVATAGQSNVRLVWNLRCSDAWLNARTRAIRRTCILLAGHSPDAIVACGERAASFHQELGYPNERMSIIPNGYRFAPLPDVLSDRARRHADRRSVMRVVGAVGRYDRSKGYSYLLRAIAILRAQGHDVGLALAGRGCVAENDELAGEIAYHGLTGAIDLHGELEDLRPFYATIDIFCLSSVSEGFPNALCEAIASGVPVVATGVGDAPQIMGPDPTIVPSSAEALAERLTGLLKAPRAAREAAAARSAVRVRAAYDLDGIADRYHALYLSLREKTDANQS